MRPIGPGPAARERPVGRRPTADPAAATPRPARVGDHAAARLGARPRDRPAPAATRVGCAAPRLGSCAGPGRPAAGRAERLVRRLRHLSHLLDGHPAGLRRCPTCNCSVVAPPRPGRATLVRLALYGAAVYVAALALVLAFR